jgi:hypothetical protein
MLFVPVARQTSSKITNHVTRSAVSNSELYRNDVRFVAALRLRYGCWIVLHHIMLRGLRATILFCIPGSMCALTIWIERCC